MRTLLIERKSVYDNENTYYLGAFEVAEEDDFSAQIDNSTRKKIEKIIHDNVPDFLLSNFIFIISEFDDKFVSYRQSVKVDSVEYETGKNGVYFYDTRDDALMKNKYIVEEEVIKKVW